MDQSSGVPLLTRSDAWILAVIVASGGRTDVPFLMVSADHVSRLVLSFDELSYGAPRLVAAGLIEVSTNDNGELILAATHAPRRWFGQAAGRWM